MLQLSFQNRALRSEEKRKANGQRLLLCSTSLYNCNLKKKTWPEGRDVEQREGEMELSRPKGLYTYSAMQINNAKVQKGGGGGS